MIVGSIWHIMQRSNWAEQCCTQSLLMRRDVIIIIMLHLFQCIHGPGSWAIAVRTCTKSISRSVSIGPYRSYDPACRHCQPYRFAVYGRCVQYANEQRAKQWGSAQVVLHNISQEEMEKDRSSTLSTGRITTRTGPLLLSICLDPATNNHRNPHQV